MKREKDPKVSQLASVFREAMAIAARMKADEVPPDERKEFLAKALQEAWPKGRIEPWNYLCRRCDDTGWEVKVCDIVSCGKRQCQKGHEYVVPCYCPKGKAMRESRSRPPQQAKPEPPKPSWGRIGR